MIGVGGVNLWAHTGGLVFKTDDRGLFLPQDSDNLVEAWEPAMRRGSTCGSLMSHSTGLAIGGSPSAS